MGCGSGDAARTSLPSIRPSHRHRCGAALCEWWTAGREFCSCTRRTARRAETERRGGSDLSLFAFFGILRDVHAFVAPVREKVDAGGGGDASAELRWINRRVREVFGGPYSPVRRPSPSRSCAGPDPWLSLSSISSHRRRRRGNPPTRSCSPSSSSPRARG